MPPPDDNPFSAEIERRRADFNPFTSEIQRRTGKPGLARSANGPRSAAGQAARTAAGGFIAGILSLPHAAGELMVSGASLLEGAGAALIPGGRGFEYGQRVEENKRFLQTPAQRAMNPASALLELPDPSAEDVLTIAGTATRLPGQIAETPLSPIDATRRAYQGARREEEEAIEAHPIASAIGQVGADIAAILSLRPRLRSGYKETGEAIANAIPQRIRNLFGGSAPTVAPEAAAAANTAADKLRRSLDLVGRGTGRAAEAGFEGALIAALGEGDPAQTAGFSAGVQAAGSMILGAKAKLFRDLKSTVFNLWLGHEVWRAVGPGEQDFFAAKDMTVREVVAAYGLGLVAVLAGANRGSAATTLVDRIAAANRSAIASIATQLQDAEDDGDPRPAAVIEQMAQDPDYFGRTARQRIEQAAESEEPNALLDTITSLFRSERFRSRYEATQAQ